MLPDCSVLRGACILLAFSQWPLARTSDQWFCSVLPCHSRPSLIKNTASTAKWCLSVTLSILQWKELLFIPSDLVHRKYIFRMCVYSVCPHSMVGLWVGMILFHSVSGNLYLLDRFPQEDLACVSLQCVSILLFGKAVSWKMYQLVYSSAVLPHFFLWEFMKHTYCLLFVFHSWWYCDPLFCWPTVHIRKQHGHHSRRHSGGLWGPIASGFCVCLLIPYDSKFVKVVLPSLLCTVPHTHTLTRKHASCSKLILY